MSEKFLNYSKTENVSKILQCVKCKKIGKVQKYQKIDGVKMSESWQNKKMSENFQK